MEKPRLTPSLGPNSEASPDIFSIPGLKDVGSTKDAAIDTVPGVSTVGTAQPARGPLDKSWARFWGTDVKSDPQQLTRLGYLISGAIMGGEAGLKFAPGLWKLPASVAGGLAGAGLGAGAPETLMNIGEEIGVLPKGYRKAFGASPEDVRTMMEGEALLELVTAGGIATARVGKKLATDFIVGANRESRAMAEAANAEGIAVLPVQMGDRKMARQFVTVLGRMPWLASPYIKAAKGVQARIADAMANLPSRVATAFAASDISLAVGKSVKSTVTEIATQLSKASTRILLKADAAGIRVSPRYTSLKARELITSINDLMPVTAKGVRTKMKPADKALSDMKDFLIQNILPMAAEQAPGIPKSQSLRVLDNFLGITDKMAARFAKAGNTEALGMVADLKTAMQRDLFENSRGEGVTDIINEFNKVGEDTSAAIQDLVDNAAVRFLGGKANRRAGIAMNGETKIDGLVGLINRGDNPRLATDLAKVIDKPTYRKLTSHVLDDRIKAAMEIGADGKTQKFNVDNFADSIGLNNKNSARYEQMAAMLKESGGLSMAEVERMVDIARKVSSLEIPSIATTVARRGTLQGVRGIFRAAVPGAILAGGAASYGGVGLATVLGGLVFVKASRSFSKMISDPTMAGYMRSALLSRRSASKASTRAAWIRIGRLALNSYFKSEGSSPEANAGTDAKFVEFMNNTWDYIEDKIKMGNRALTPINPFAASAPTPAATPAK